MSLDHYIIRGGTEGRERLRSLARVMQPTTLSLFDRTRITGGMVCLDVGCGGGDVSIDLARMVGHQGKVVGTDLDKKKLELARQEAIARNLNNIEFRYADIVDDSMTGDFDLVYARFVLSHLPDPAGALMKLYRVLRPGGIIIVEDLEIRGHFSYPDCPALGQYIELYTEAAKRRGADANIGTRLPGLLLQAGFRSVEMNVVQPAGLDFDIKSLIPVTVKNIAQSVVAEGLATTTEMEQIVSKLHAFARDPQTVMSIPRVIQSWGHRPDDSEANR